MGWTHYWDRQPELDIKAFSNASADCREVLSQLDIELGNNEGENSPIITDEEILFNGPKGRLCEPFIIRRSESPRLGRTQVFCYCKTEKLPYDLCVQCCLIILQHHFDGCINVKSDGTDEDWIEARNICQKVLGYGKDFVLSKSDA